MEHRYTPAGMITHAAEGRLEEWVHSFLHGPGDNVPLSDGLKRQPRYWIGPVEAPLALLERCCGPEIGLEYVIDETGWEQTMGSMAASLRNGWTPPPLIAQYRPEEGIFSVRDGNHRHEALRRSGQQAWWCVIWCDSEQVREEALRLLAEGMKVNAR